MFSGTKFFFTTASLQEDKQNKLRDRIIDAGGDFSTQKRGSVGVALDEQDQEFTVAAKEEGRECPFLGFRYLEELLEKKRALPKLSELPRFSTIFQGLVVFIAGVPRAEFLETLVRWHSGESSPILNSRVTHVVTVYPTSQQYQDYGKKIVRSEWIAQSIQFVKRLPEKRFPVLVSGTSIFKGTKVTLSGFPREKKAILEEYLKNNGALVDQDLSKSCTHVIIDPKSKSLGPGTKYHYAITHKLFLITHKWIYRSLTKNARLSEFDFKFVPLVDPKIDIKSDGDVVKTEKIKTEVLSQKTKRKSRRYLRDCHFYLLGFNEDMIKREKEKIFAAGGNRYPCFCDKITHVIVKQDSEIVRSLEKIAIAPNRCHILSFEWLQACHQSKSYEDITPYSMRAAPKKREREFESEVPPIKKQKFDSDSAVVSPLVETSKKAIVSAPIQPSSSNNKTLFQNTTFLILLPSPENEEVISLLDSNGAVCLQINSKNVPDTKYAVVQHYSPAIPKNVIDKSCLYKKKLK